MSAALKHRLMTFEDFLSWESHQDARWEFDGFAPVAMVGGTRSHARIQTNLAVAIAGLRDDVVVEQDRVRVTHHARDGDGTWQRRELTGLSDMLHLGSPRLAIPLSEIYAGITPAPT